MKKIFTLNRNGEVFISSRNWTNNQCKDVGFNHYEYNVKIRCADKLDDNGFLIDQLVIHETVVKVFNKIGSCEELCVEIEQAISKVCKLHGTKLYSCYVKVSPRTPPSLNYAFMEYEVEYDEPILDKKYTSNDRSKIYQSILNRK